MKSSRRAEKRALLAAALALLLAGAESRAQAPAATAGTDGAAGVATAAAPSAPSAPKLVDENYVLAAVNSEVVTVRDVLLEWRLEGRLLADPDRPFTPTQDDRRKIAKNIVMDRLWVVHAKENPFYAEFATPREIDGEAKRSRFGTLFEDASLPADERELIRKKGELMIAMQIALQTDPDYRRCLNARPEDVRRWYDAHPEMHHVSTQVTMGRVLLGRENAKELYGESAATLVERLRQRAVELSSLEAAAKELAPGSYQTTKTYEIDRETGLVEDVLKFASTAVVGELSAPIAGSSSIMLFTLLSRQEGRDVTYADAAPRIKIQLQNLRCQLRADQYFVAKILPEAYFLPENLFDNEIEQFIPGFKAQRARAEAAAAARK